MIPRNVPAISVVIMAASICLVFTAGSADAASGVLIHGYVFDRDHRVVSNATVTLLKDDALLPTSSNPALTDTNGYYAFWGIGRGQYCLMAARGYYSYANTILVQDWDVMQNFTFTATSAEMADLHEPTATPAAAVTPAVSPLPDNSSAPTPEAAPGFGLLALLPGIVAAAAMAQRKKRP